MELWFVYAVASAITGRLYAFVQKVASAKDLNSTLIASYSAGIAGVFGLVTAVFTSGFSDWNYLIIAYAFICGALYVVGAITRLDALKYIDSTIFFPLYKLLGPLVAIGFGFLFFQEYFSSIEWLGIFLSVTVPLLLVSKSEKGRQSNLTKGLWLLVLCSVFTAASTAVGKAGADLFVNLLMFVGWTNFFSFLFGMGLFGFTQRKKSIKQPIAESANMQVFILVCISGIFQFLTTLFLTLGYAHGTLGLVYTINSLYILIPIVLSILFYKEHWNARKAIAIILSILALTLLK